MITITLPRNHASSRMVAGIAFTDGVAKVRRIGSHARRFLEMLGATITNDVNDAPTVADAPALDTDAEEKPLEKRTVPELLVIAERMGVEIPAKAKKPEIINALKPAPVEEE